MGFLDKLMFWRKKDEFADIGLGDKQDLAFGEQFGAQPGAAPGTGLPPAPGGFEQQAIPGPTPPGPSPLGPEPGPVPPGLPPSPQPQMA